MAIETIFQGNLFTSDFLTQSIQQTDDWKDLSSEEIETLQSGIVEIFAKFPTNQTPNEQRTEDDLIWPILSLLGWDHSMRQQNMTTKGRDDVPDGLLFASAEDKTLADQNVDEWKRYNFGKALVESKRWLRPLDRSSNKSDEVSAPSTQMLRYLRRADDLTEGKMRWGILTNGNRWRLYFSGARSVSEQFFDIDLAAIFQVSAKSEGSTELKDEDKLHSLRAFVLMFRREAFILTDKRQKTFHQHALDEGKFYEERVANDLSNKVFNSVFPIIVRAIAGQLPETSLEDIRQASLIFLYRLLFILYAEDRNLLPINDQRYVDYGLRDKVRMDVKRRKDEKDTFSTSAARYWNVLDDLCRAIDKGDKSIGLPPYNGGLFDPDKTPVLTEVRLGDAIIADVIDYLSFEQKDSERQYINYRDLSVQQLGSIYERLLEYEVVRNGPIVDIRPNIFARKGSGSYYTPDDLVKLILNETLEPLIDHCHETFESASDGLTSGNDSERKRRKTLGKSDPAKAILNLKICDPAMGSGHFLVSLVDYLTDQVIQAIATSEKQVEWTDYTSPLLDEIDDIRDTILSNAKDGDWIVNIDQLDDKHIIRRMVLKRCVYGVDKNAMAVELAKVALWLHSFTVGAPLSFLDHHLRNGDSLFGELVFEGMDKVSQYGAPLIMAPRIKRAISSAASMHRIEGLADTEITESQQSRQIFEGVKEMTSELNAILSFVHALRWQNLKSKLDQSALVSFFAGEFGDPFSVLVDSKYLRLPPKRRIAAQDSLNAKYEAQKSKEKKRYSLTDQFERFAEIYDEAIELISEENFFNWQVAFPGIWSDWTEPELTGGFDAVVGNPPWDRMKLQQVEWFAARKPEIAKAQKAADRTKMIKALQKAGDPLFAEYKKASERAATSTKIARSCGNYPLLSGGDTNLYSLFVEQAMRLIKPEGLIGLLTPSGIASDKTAAKFFKGVSTTGRLKALYDFENKKVFFPDVDSRFKFCVFVAAKKSLTDPAQCAFFLHKISDLDDTERKFSLSAKDFATVNPNTGTAPIFRSRRDAELTKGVYKRLPVLVDHSSGKPVKTWPVKYSTMFHMTNDSGLFRTKHELEEQVGGYPKGGNIFGSSSGDWVPLYVGRMIHQFDHRAASIKVNESNLHNAALSTAVTSAQKQTPVC